MPTRWTIWASDGDTIATDAATSAATEAATLAATWDATSAATWAATWDATEAATSTATEAATKNKDDGKTWYNVLPLAMAELARRLSPKHHKFFLKCAASSGSMWNGGNQWSGWASYLAFFRGKIDLDYPKLDPYQTLAERSGPRIMHKDFCIISDRPEVLTVDTQNRPHNISGPFCRWRDGSALYAIHGVRVPQYVVERPDLITVEKIHAEGNAEVKRVMIERYGLSRYVRDAQFQVIDADLDPLGLPRRLLRKDDLVVVELTNSTLDADGTRRVYHVPCHPNLRPLLSNGELGEPQKLTALAAVASTYGLRAEEYVLEVET